MTVGELLALLERYDPSLPVGFNLRDHGFVEVGNVVVWFNVSRFEPPDAFSGPHAYVEVVRLPMAAALVASEWEAKPPKIEAREAARLAAERHDPRYRVGDQPCYLCGGGPAYCQTKDMVLSPEELKNATCDVAYTATVWLCARCACHTPPEVVEAALDAHVHRVKHGFVRWPFKP